MLMNEFFKLVKFLFEHTFIWSTNFSPFEDKIFWNSMLDNDFLLLVTATQMFNTVTETRNV